MFLKSLELHGFKSFPDRTKLEFGTGITAVVGPNGSGKSNISDAVRWVLGEQSSKTLRGAKMEDVIFGGTQIRKPQGFAEVSLTIDNSSRLLAVDSETVTITRKYYRSTESEYLINGSQVRLKDINELLMDTGLGRDGYSMVGQGKIAEIVGAKSAERREIFEEAAGISKFRYRKEESERRLKMAEENLLRLLDIVQELESRIGPLKTQSEKAKQYLELATRKNELEISFWVQLLNDLTVRLRDQDDKFTIASGEEEEISRTLRSLEQLDQDTLELAQGCLVLAEQLRTEKQEKISENADVMAQIAVVKNDISHNLDDIERLKNELIALDQSDQVIEADIAKRTAAIEEKKALIGSYDERISVLIGEQDATSEQTDSFNERTSELRSCLAEIALQKTEQTVNADIANKRVLELEEAVVKDCTQVDERKADLEKIISDKEKIAKDLESCFDRIRSLENSLKGYLMKQGSRHQKLDAAAEELNSLDRKVAEKRQRIRLLQDLEKNMEGFNGSVKAVLRARESGRLRGIRGSVAQLVTVESRYSVAIETALGATMQNIVVDNENSAKAAMQFLKEERVGRATFLPLTSIKGNAFTEKNVDKEEGYVALAPELLKYDPAYDSIIRWAVGRVVIAEDIDVAISIAKKYNYRFKIVTLDGQVVNAGGSYTGGFTARNQGILSRKNDIDHLEEELSKLSGTFDSLKQRKDQLFTEVAELDAQVQAIQSEIRTFTEDRIRLESELQHLEQITSEYGNQIDLLNERVKQQTAQISSLRENIQKAEEVLRQLSVSEDEQKEQLSRLEGDSSELLVQVERISSEITQLRTRKAELNKEIESSGEFIAALESRKMDSAENSKKLSEQIESLLTDNSELELKIVALNQGMSDREKEITDIDHRIADAHSQHDRYEEKRTNIRKDQRHYNDRHEDIIREMTHLEEQKAAAQKEYDGIINQMWNEYEITRSQAETAAKPIDDFNEHQRELNVVKSKIKGLGNVNLAAVEEYKEVSKRYEELSEQIRDVERSKDELTRLIGDLTENMKELFSESFEKINRNFKQIFSDLFGGGKGELILTDPDDVLETGIEINVQPPGKVIKNLASLSGGEQAFVAIAIYFAILKVRPAPFCILDEIEAALDDVNVSKYAHYLRSYSDNTQFILITHRRGTMEEADVLYGVTMQQEGISKLLELNVGEAEKSMGNLIK